MMLINITNHYFDEKSNETYKLDIDINPASGQKSYIFKSFLHLIAYFHTKDAFCEQYEFLDGTIINCKGNFMFKVAEDITNRIMYHGQSFEDMIYALLDSVKLICHYEYIDKKP